MSGPKHLNLELPFVSSGAVGLVCLRGFVLSALGGKGALREEGCGDGPTSQPSGRLPQVRTSTFYTRLYVLQRLHYIFHAEKLFFFLPLTFWFLLGDEWRRTSPCCRCGQQISHTSKRRWELGAATACDWYLRFESRYCTHTFWLLCLNYRLYDCPLSWNKIFYLFIYLFIFLTLSHVVSS